MSAAQRNILIVAIIAAGIAMLDGSIINVALPAIARSIGGGLVTQQWVIDGYLLTLSAFILLAGSLSDLVGRIKILAIGVIGFAAASLVCALAPTAGMLIAGRLMQGIAGALLVPSSLALIIATFPKGRAQGQAIGAWTAWTGISFLIGPVLGGVLVDYGSWRWIFVINLIPTCIILILLSRSPKHHDAELRPIIDWLGGGLCAIGLGGVVFALIEQGHYGWGSPAIQAPSLIGLVALLAFYAHERRTKAPMLPLSLFRVRNFYYGNLATTAIYAALSATFVITIFVQQVSHYTALAAGLALLPVTLIMFVASPRFGALAGRYSPRLFMTLGPLVAALGFIAMLRVAHQATYLTQLLPAVLCFGLGLSLTVAPLTTAVLGGIDPSEAGIASAINNAVARVAGLLAVALTGLVTGASLTTESFHRACLAIAALLIVGAIISAAGIRSPHIRRATS